jgi:hypothetical protein
MNDGIAITLRYLDVLHDTARGCPECGTDYIDSDWYGDIEMNQFELPRGKWYCYRCRDAFSSSDYLDPDDPENATVPTW